MSPVMRQYKRRARVPRPKNANRPSRQGGAMQSGGPSVRRAGWRGVAMPVALIVAVVGISVTLEFVPVSSVPVTALAPLPGGGHLGVLSEANKVWSYQPESRGSPDPTPDSGGGTVVATVQVGIRPAGVVYDIGNGYVYVANFGSNNVSVISGTRV